MFFFFFIRVPVARNGKPLGGTKQRYAVTGNLDVPREHRVVREFWWLCRYWLYKIMLKK